MAQINKLRININHETINANYDFFLISTSEKFFQNGAYILDKPISQLSAESIVFDYGKTIFAMFRKNHISRLSLLEQIGDQTISIKQIRSFEIKDYILIRLFLYSLNNYVCDELQFNNLTGKLYISSANWIAKNRKIIKTLHIDVDAELCVTCEATAFSLLDCFANAKEFSNYPKYSLSNNCCLKREINNENKNVYIKRNAFGGKVEIPFFSFKNEKELKNNKMYHLYHVIDIMNSKFDKMCRAEFEIVSVLHTIGNFIDTYVFDYVNSRFAFKDINLINWANDAIFDNEFSSVVELFKKEKTMSQVTVSSSINPRMYNLVFLHNRDYYLGHRYNDPYKNIINNSIVQHITVEDSVNPLLDDNKSIYNTILKEFIIKEDILKNRKITIHDWSSFGFEGEYIFGKEKDGIIFFMIVKPDGSICFFSKLNTFSGFDKAILNTCSDYLTVNKGKEKTIIVSPNSDIIILSRTKLFTVPSNELFSMEKISRSNDSRNRYLSGVVDINMFEINGKHYYNSGIKGIGMNACIPKAPILYKVDVIKGNDFYGDLLATMAVSFVKYKSFTVLPYPIKYLNEYILIEEKKYNK